MLVAGDVGGTKTDLAVYSGGRRCRGAYVAKRVPVHIIVTNAALSGAAAYAFENLRD